MSIVIPSSIKREHVLLAIAEMRKGEIPTRREATKFTLVEGGRLYPPKYAISVAARYATGVELAASAFTGGEEANSFLRSLHFEIQAIRTDWSWKECYLAVWGYDQLDQDPSQVKTLLYAEIADLVGRSAKSVEFKIQNVSSFDSRPRQQKPIAEAKNAQALLGKVFRWYWSDRQKARLLYPQVREEFEFGLESTTNVEPPKADDPSQVIIEEGASSSAQSVRRKRSQKLLDEGRRHFRGLDPEGKLRCHACRFTTPLGLNHEIVQLHHTEPIYDADRSGRTLALKDALALLLPLCPTCHALAHTSRPPLSVAMIRALMQ